MKSRWWALLFSAAALLCLLLMFLHPGSGQNDRIGVFLDGVLLREIRLQSVTETYEFTVSSSFGENVIRVEPDSVYIIQSDCPDGTCLRHAPLPGAPTPIVCLPHRLVLRILSDGAQSFDAISGAAG